MLHARIGMLSMLLGVLVAGPCCANLVKPPPATADEFSTCNLNQDQTADCDVDITRGAAIEYTCDDQMSCETATPLGPDGCKFFTVSRTYDIIPRPGRPGRTVPISDAQVCRDWCEQSLRDDVSFPHGVGRAICQFRAKPVGPDGSHLCYFFVGDLNFKSGPATSVCQGSLMSCPTSSQDGNSPADGPADGPPVQTHEFSNCKGIRFNQGGCDFDVTPGASVDYTSDPVSGPTGCTLKHTADPSAEPVPDAQSCRDWCTNKFMNPPIFESGMCQFRPMPAPGQSLCYFFGAEPDTTDVCQGSLMSCPASSQDGD